MPDGVAALRRLVTEDELAAEGERFGSALAPGAVVLLEGELGAGKTTLIRAIVHGLGGTEAASSPTYTLVHHYEGRRGPVYHVDCYRLRTPDEAADLVGRMRTDMSVVSVQTWRSWTSSFATSRSSADSSTGSSTR